MDIRSQQCYRLAPRPPPSRCPPRAIALVPSPSPPSRRPRATHLEPSPSPNGPCPQTALLEFLPSPPGRRTHAALHALSPQPYSRPPRVAPRSCPMSVAPCSRPPSSAPLSHPLSAAPRSPHARLLLHPVPELPSASAQLPATSASTLGGTRVRPKLHLPPAPYWAQPRIAPVPCPQVVHAPSPSCTRTLP